MIFINCEQGTEEWHKARCGVITASKFRDAVETTANGKPTAKSELYAAQVALERISGLPCDEVFNSWQMRRGTELEPKARMEYESRTGNLASESGVVLTDDRLFGYSTDGELNGDGLIEIKCLASAIGVLEMWRDQDLSAYMHQIQGGLWITGRKYCDFVMYAPQLESVGKQLFTKRVERNEEFIDDMVEQLLAFSRVVDKNETIFRMKEAA
ncbi:lambda exonuclease family protein [Herminiimonas contaminans]|uniref:YqaJ viral recombinase family protein n=1 Tax=Herminiimonas contaminans TaxID=1111140 RepID=A0ABS0ET55_9BURK|nr:lambda exonuclease family protein [Herminiimonas contaminans]MBF8177693.1 YqaJ viral recombinase family protein [Herminiimonas contaminans]